jgi:hypothetical protein
MARLLAVGGEGQAGHCVHFEGDARDRLWGDRGDAKHAGAVEGPIDDCIVQSPRLAWGVPAIL